MSPLVLLAASLMCVTPAFAQETGSLINRGPTAGANGRTPDDARAVMLGYAACVTGRYPGRVKAMLALPVTDPVFKRMHESMFQEYSDCLSGGNMSEIRFSTLSLRGALFEAMYRREFAKSAPDVVAATPPIDYLKGYATPLTGEATTFIALGRYGDCVARRDTADVRLLVLATPGSAQERQGFAGVMPHLGPCLPKGEQLRFSKSILRGAMAEGLYRLSASVTGAGQ